MTSGTHAFDTAVVIGRFQPFHNGHMTLLRRALETAPTVVVVLGSAFHARNPKNPWTWRERADMILASLDAGNRQRLRFAPVRDHYDDQRWADAVVAGVSAAMDGDTGRVALVGHEKDFSSSYLTWFPHWSRIEVPLELPIDATRIRKRLFEAETSAIDRALFDIRMLVPAAVSTYLRQWVTGADHAAMAEEYARLAAYKAAWASAPYPPIFCTVDAVVRAAGHVLLIQRGDYPGKGLWALPGGFIEEREHLLTSALRELTEETCIAVPNDALLAALKDRDVFDHPARSLRGRTITHAFFFDLEMDSLPAITAGDDAARAQWVPLGALAAMEEQFHDDHYHIIARFIAADACLDRTGQ